MLDQSKAPLLESLQASAHRPDAAFYAPGHKRGQGIARELATWWGLSVFQADLPELPELDNLFAPSGAIALAQKLAAEAFGAAESWFLANGSTAGIIASILTVTGPGDKIILPRNIHSSAISGLILSGAIPIFIYPEYDDNWDLYYGMAPEAVAAALKKHPDAKAVMMVYPTYHGICGDVAAIARIAHQHRIPLLIDEAHGPHFAFHPELPPPALALGADLTVQSIHKVLGAMTQASMLHISSNQINSLWQLDRDRLARSLQIVQSTSPSYLLLTSLDAARRQMVLKGKELMTRTLGLADRARAQIEKIPALSVLQPVGSQETSSGFCALDLTRLTVKVSELGLTGYEADEILHQELGVTAELPSLTHLTFIISLGNAPADIDRLVQALTTLAQDYRRSSLPEQINLVSTKKTAILESPISPPLSPREAFFAPVETLAIEQIEQTAYRSSHVSAELVCPYPPGIPVLMPGEVITEGALDFLKQTLALGGVITGCSDPELTTLKVISSNRDRS